MMTWSRRPEDPLSVLAYPHPYEAWLCLSNDPDNTSEQEWLELHTLIWKELELPFADSLFIRSFNRSLPHQVNLNDHPFIAEAHPHDTLHTWGDYTLSGQKGFDRAEAERNIEILEKHGIRPRVWVDHSNFAGNLLHRSTRGSTAHFSDLAGHVYENPEYTLDLIHGVGIRYVWDGQLTGYLGQDVERDRTDYYRDVARSGLKGSLKRAVGATPLHRLAQAVAPERFDYRPEGNRQYSEHEFADGTTLYCFRRHGEWQHADIDGLQEVISPGRIELLLQREGTCIVYTHLGKRKAEFTSRARHIPAGTRIALENLKDKHDQRQLMLSSVSRLLDYLVLRDHLSIDERGQTLEFRPDGVRFTSLGPGDMSGMRFSFRWRSPPAGQWNVRVQARGGGELPFELERHSDVLFTVQLD